MQRKVIRIIRGKESLVYEKRVNELGCFTPARGLLRKDMIASCNCISRANTKARELYKAKGKCLHNGKWI